MKKEDCIFCKIANGEIPSKTLYEDGDFRVILDLGPATGGYSGKSICSCKKDGNKDDREITLRWSQYRTE